MAVDRDKYTPITSAASQGYKPLVELLLDKESELMNVSDARGLTAFHGLRMAMRM